MMRELVNHLWQSTLFAAAAWLLILAFRNNRAGVRYWLWFAASLKFLVPFALLMSAGSQLVWAPPAARIAAELAPSVPLAIVQVSQPFSDTSLPGTPGRGSRNWAGLAIAAVWGLGFAGIAGVRLRGWRRIRAALRASSPINLRADVDLRSAPGLLEPGVTGWLRPVLLLPAGIEEKLTPAQLEAVLAHELCHVRRRDNLWASIHMLVEGVFWFHPVVWWIGAKMLEERERACDEEVLSLGGEPRVYAEGILNVCKLYAESPLLCVPGVTGSNLKKRIELIMGNRTTVNVSLVKKAILASAGILALAVPIWIGVVSAPRIRVEAASAGVPKFETVLIEPGCAPAIADIRKSGDGVRKTGPGAPAGPPNLPVIPGPGSSPGSLTVNCVTIAGLVNSAYGQFASGRPLAPSDPFHYVYAVPMSGGPAWLYADRYHITAKAPGDTGQEMMRGPMMQALLEERFHLKVRRETRDVPGYALTVAAGGLKMQPFAGECTDSMPPAPGQNPCMAISSGPKVPATFSPSFGPDTGVKDMDGLSLWLFAITDRPIVNKTGITGRFFVNFAFAPDQDTPGALERLAIVARRNGGTGALAAPSNPPGPSIFAALEQQLGLKLESTTATRTFVFIDHAERP